jgi:hypothetical protein
MEENQSAATPAPTSITVTINTGNMDAIRDWLREYAGRAPRDALKALWAYTLCQMRSNNEWDGVPIAIKRGAGQ